MNDMTESFQVPAEVAAAIVAVAVQVRQIGQDERNPHGGYQYVSVDKFYERIGPLMAGAGLFLLVDEVSADVREGAKGNAWLFTRYALRFAHAGGTCSAPLYRSCAQPISGPQAFGSAQSYIEKQFLRQVFKIPTGDKDVTDSLAEDTSAPVSQARTAPRVVAHGNGASPPNKPIQTPPQDAVYDPETGEVGPHPIPVPMTPTGKPDWIKWGGELVGHLQRAETLAEGEEWLAQCEPALLECDQQSPKVHDRIQANIGVMRERFEPPADFMVADDPLRPL